MNKLKKLDKKIEEKLDKKVEEKLDKKRLFAIPYG